MSEVALAESPTTTTTQQQHNNNNKSTHQLTHSLLTALTALLLLFTLPRQLPLSSLSLALSQRTTLPTKIASPLEFTVSARSTVLDGSTVNHACAVLRSALRLFVPWFVLFLSSCLFLVGRKASLNWCFVFLFRCVTTCLFFFFLIKQCHVFFEARKTMG